MFDDDQIGKQELGSRYADKYSLRGKWDLDLPKMNQWKAVNKIIARSIRAGGHPTEYNDVRVVQFEFLRQHHEERSAV